jgi:hypothetical protein
LLILSEAYVGVIIQSMSREPRGRVWREKVWQKPVPNFLRPVRLDLSAESAAIQQCFSLTTNQRTVLSAQ